MTDSEGEDVGGDVLNMPPEDIRMENPGEVYFEQYKLCFHSLERSRERRQRLNLFFLSINAAVCIGIFAFAGSAYSRLYPLLPVIGIVSCFFWSRMVLLCRKTCIAKSAILHDMEKHLPLSPDKLFCKSHLMIGEDSSDIYTVTFLEVWIPRLLILTYLGGAAALMSP